MKFNCIIFFLLLNICFFKIGFPQSNNNADAKAEKIAQEVIAAIGGTENFNNTKYIGWNYFDYRQLIWDKVHDRVRVDYLKKDLTIIADINGSNVKLFMNGEEITQPDSLDKYLAKGKKIWMNDSYWLLMPFKLLDGGVHLKYTGTKKTIDSVDADVLELTFENVGLTPENKYWVFINPETHLVIQWDYFEKYSDEKPEIINTWGDYNKYGNILISGDRGTEGKITDIHVWEQLPSSVFTDKKIPPMSEIKN